jgi:hypothetical protein
MKKFFNAVLFALQGIKQFISRDRNGKIQIVFGADRDHTRVYRFTNLFSMAACIVLYWAGHFA